MPLHAHNRDDFFNKKSNKVMEDIVKKIVKKTSLILFSHVANQPLRMMVLGRCRTNVLLMSCTK
jgi:uncharacterized protein YejL (UPF0352 family)